MNARVKDSLFILWITICPKDCGFTPFMCELLVVVLLFLLHLLLLLLMPCATVSASTWTIFITKYLLLLVGVFPLYKCFWGKGTLVFMWPFFMGYSCNLNPFLSILLSKLFAIKTKTNKKIWKGPSKGVREIYTCELKNLFFLFVH